MQYKTIILEMIQEQPELYEQLRSSKRLLTALDSYAIELKTSHEQWMDRLNRKRPGSDRSQVSSEALEFALKDLEEVLSSASKADADGPTLDGAMAYLRRHTPTV